MPDTDDADASAEKFWPEEYKRVIKDGLKKAFKAALQEGKSPEIVLFLVPLETF